MGAPKGGNSGRKNLRKVGPGERVPGSGRKKGTRNSITELRLSQEVARIAFGDPVELFHRQQSDSRRFTLKEIHEMSPEVRACIASVKVKTENLTTGDHKQDKTVEIRLWNKGQMLEVLAHKFGWYKHENTLALEGVDALVKKLDEWKARNKG